MTCRAMMPDLAKQFSYHQLLSADRVLQDCNLKHDFDGARPAR